MGACESSNNNENKSGKTLYIKNIKNPTDENSLMIVL